MKHTDRKEETQYRDEIDRNSNKKWREKEKEKEYLVVGLGFEFSEDKVLVGEAVGRH